MFTAAKRLNVLAAHLPRVTATTPTSISSLRAAAPNFKVGSSFSTAQPVDMSSAKELVDKAIKENNVLVFSKSYCPYCRRAKQILDSVTKEMEVYELDERDDGADIQAYVKQLTGQGTVPSIFIHQKFIGGCSELQAIPKGELVKRIQAAA